MKKPLSRREFLMSVAGVAGALSISPILVACSPAAIPRGIHPAMSPQKQSRVQAAAWSEYGAG